MERGVGHGYLIVFLSSQNMETCSVSKSPGQNAVIMRNWRHCLPFSSLKGGTKIRGCCHAGVLVGGATSLPEKASGENIFV